MTGDDFGMVKLFDFPCPEKFVSVWGLAFYIIIFSIRCLIISTFSHVIAKLCCVLLWKYFVFLNFFSKLPKSLTLK